MRKPMFYNDHFLSSTISADTYSSWIDAMNLDRLSLEIIMGAGWTGDVYLEQSNDPGSTKTAVDTGIVIEPFAGSAGNRIVNATALAGRFYRLFFDHSSGSGVVAVKAQGKG
jgi:hypothetical protein